MVKWKSGLDVAANLAILSVCILIGFIGVRKFLLGEAHAPEILREGSRLEIPSVDWSHANHTLVLVLSTGCHFCNESADFYRRLAPIASTARVPVVAVFPQPIEEARTHWTSQNLPLIGVSFAQVPGGKLPVAGTPTVILVDHKGVVLRAWTGKQTASGEAAIIDLVQEQGART